MDDSIVKAGIDDVEILAELAAILWVGHTVDDLKQEFTDAMSEKDTQFFIKYDSGEAVGFAQCQLRHDYVEGTRSSPVGYLEGIFVKEEYRKKGYAAQLLNRCESWAREAGCTEFASDCELSNSTSLAFHLAVGFEEANRIICFTKKL